MCELLDKVWMQKLFIDWRIFLLYHALYPTANTEWSAEMNVTEIILKTTIAENNNSSVLI